MQILRILQVVFEGSAAVASAGAAYLWWRASKVAPIPHGGEQAGVHSMQQDAWISSLMQAYSESSALNSSAARWAAFAALFAVFAALATATLL